MLSLIAWIYGKVVATRNYFYDRGLLDTFDLDAYTVSIGNITTGGTGKTPLVVYVAKLLSGRGEKVCVLTRGYKRRNEKERVLVSDGEQILADPFTAGDEPYELAKELLGQAVVIAGADRASAGEWAKRRFGATAFVLDDGFQHRRVLRDVDIVCIDATDPFGDGKMLPAGRLREPAEKLRRADAVVITRSDLAGDLSDLRSKISELAPEIAVFTSRNKIDVVVGLEESHAKPRSAQSTEKNERKLPDKGKFVTRQSLAFCGIGNPESFFAMLRNNSFDLAAVQTFRDHHVYSDSDIRSIESAARAAGCEILLTTAKDAVKLSKLNFEFPCFVVKGQIEIDDAELFAALV